VLVGRGAEEAAVERLLTNARAGQGGALVLRGEAGIGKSALLEDSRALASEFRILQAVGIESEAELAFAGLHQLLIPLLDRLDLLPRPQAAALRAAFALSDETVAERFRISLGTLGLLAAAADPEPVLCLVDDAQWLDDASATALLFVARRLVAEHVAILFAARDDASHPFDAAGIADLRILPLSNVQARQVAAQRLGLHAAPAALDWVVDNARGNPLALVELPQALTDEQISGRASLTDVPPEVTSVERSFSNRITRLPAPVQRLLLVAACEETGNRATIDRAAQALGIDAEQLAEAEKHRLITVGLERVAFRHPLVRSAALRSASFGEREATHRALANVLSDAADADRRAWHLALSASGPDDAVAAELEATADRARRRAGYAGAATALERAGALSSQPEDQVRRLVAAAKAAWQAGQRDRATTLLTSVMSSVTDPRQRAERDHVLGLVELSCGSLPRAAATLIGAAEVVQRTDPAVALELLFDAGVAAGRAGSAALIADVVRRVSALPPSTTERDQVVRDLLTGIGNLTIGGVATEASRVRSAVDRAQRYNDPRVLGWAAFGAAAIGYPAMDAALARALTAAREFGAVPALVLILETQVISSHLAGRYSFAVEAEEGLRLARETGVTNSATGFLASLSWLHGLRGQDDACRGYAADVVADVGNGMAMANTIAQWAVALLDLAGGAADKTISRLNALRAAPVGESHPLFVLMTTADLVEAYVQTGRLDDAATAFVPLRAFAAPGAPAWSLAMAARCHALLSEGAEAERAFNEALGFLSNLNRPFDRARTHLLFGSLLRRQRRRGDARQQLRQALDGFERIAAEPWAERTRVELRATGETARKRDPSTLTQLTPQELQVARLVGSGLSNKDVAAQLFLSSRTVEYHLAKIFAKLGLTSRADLIRQSVVLEPAG
jgi:DNA-binding CsgD family transcriptional regulator